MKAATIKAKNSMIKKALHDCAELSTGGDGNLLVSGAKASHKGGGWWFVRGYAQDGGDFDKAIKLING